MRAEESSPPQRPRESRCLQSWRESLGQGLFGLGSDATTRCLPRRSRPRRSAGLVIARMGALPNAFGGA